VCPGQANVDVIAEIADDECAQLKAEIVEVKTECAWKGALLKEADETIGDIQQKIADTQWELEAIRTKIQILTESAATNWYRR
jgi:vacuolar-type H+-ATPase subunit I/STV1